MRPALVHMGTASFFKPTKRCAVSGDEGPCPPPLWGELWGYRRLTLTNAGIAPVAPKGCYGQETWST